MPRPRCEIICKEMFELGEPERGMNRCRRLDSLSSSLWEEGLSAKNGCGDPAGRSTAHREEYSFAIGSLLDPWHIARAISTM